MNNAVRMEEGDSGENLGEEVGAGGEGGVGAVEGEEVGGAEGGVEDIEVYGVGLAGGPGLV